MSKNHSFFYKGRSCELDTHVKLNEVTIDKLPNLDVSNLSDSELLALILRSGSKTCGVFELSKNLLLSAGSLRGVFSSSAFTLQKVKGIGVAKSMQLVAISELHKRIQQEKLVNLTSLNTAEKCVDYLSAMLCDKKQECFSCLLLSNRFHYLGYQELFYGNKNSSPVYIGEVMRVIIDYNAVNVIIAHNHPSGDPSPSDSDIDMTAKLKKALGLIDVNLVDHIIIANRDYTSLASLGYL